MRYPRLLFAVNLLFSILFLFACQPTRKQLKEGRWRGEFQLAEHKIPFVFEVKRINPDSSEIFLINGAERFPLKQATFRSDSVLIAVDLYDAVLAGKLSGNTFSGKFRKLYTEKPDEGISFIAVAGEFPRFETAKSSPAVSLSGTWDVEMGAAGSTDRTVGVFECNGSEATGSILTSTGDLRYLDGIVDGRKFMLSAFSGNSPYLATGEFTSDTTFTGEFVTARRTMPLTGKCNPKAALPDPYSFSGLKEGEDSLKFAFPNLDNVKVSLADPAYKGKVVIISILGTWCPNCLDETAFLAPWYKENQQRGVEIIGLAFERKNDFLFAKRTLSRLKERFDIRYELLFAGLAGTESASKALPALNGIKAFPSTIFVDKKGKVRKVHTGFSGPATGRFYQEFQSEFNACINDLLAE